MAPAAQSALRLVVIVTVVGLLVGGCGSSDTEQVGPGPDVGPVEPAGPESPVGPVEPAGPESPVGPVGDEQGVPGSTNITTETRAVDPFDGIVFNSEGDVVLVQSSRPSLSLTGDDNLHQYIEAVSDDSTLTISTSAGTDIAPSRPIIFRVGVAGLSALELQGVGMVSAEELETGVLSVIHSGVGDIRIDVLRADQLVVDHRGVGNITVSGEVDDQQVWVSGAGEYNGAELVSRVAEVQAAGTGKVTVWVSEELSSTVSDLGRVAFYGAPEVDQQVSGSASMIALGVK
jgi:hypothetical protein